MLNERVDLFTESSSLAELLEQDSPFPSSSLKRHRDETGTVYFLRNVDWTNLMGWLDENHWRMNEDVSYEVRGAKTDAHFRTYDKGEVYEGEDILEPLYDALREEANRANTIELKFII